MPAWVFIGGICACSISTKISCAGSKVLSTGDLDLEKDRGQKFHLSACNKRVKSGKDK